MQPFDYTTLIAVCGELKQDCLPARFEQAYQCDRHTLALGLRTFQGRRWLTLSWHPQSARLHLGDPPPREPDTFTFSKQLQSLLKGLALVQIEPISPWERALDLQFASRPGDAIQWHFYLEIMGKHSNAILVNQDGEIVTAAHQVSLSQSRVRPIQTGQPYQPPPALQDAIPRLEESFTQWQENVALIPGTIARQLVKSYRGVSSALATELVIGAGLDPLLPNDRLSLEQWNALFGQWCYWLTCVRDQRFAPRGTAQGYTVLGNLGEAGQKSNPREEPEGDRESIQAIVYRHYCEGNDRQKFQEVYQKVRQNLTEILQKYRQKLSIFENRLAESQEADRYRIKGDLLMAHLSRWKPGLKQLELLDFETDLPLVLSLDPEKNAVQNAQFFYKQHQKLKRVKDAVLPLLSDLQMRIGYLEQVEESLKDVSEYQSKADLMTLGEIADELREQGYVGKSAKPSPGGKDKSKGRKERSHLSPSSRDSLKPSQVDFHRYQSPSGYEVLVGRNNRQNDQLSFRVATEYDLWFHTQEIPGSHVLLRLPPGSQADSIDLQYVANVAAYHSRARQSEQVPVVYTLPKYVYKPKGNPPGLVIYKHETIIWGRPLMLSTARSRAVTPAVGV
jgi:predicted ribosome quality control (RQC) complex YloA/Tae2 family protein